MYHHIQPTVYFLWVDKEVLSHTESAATSKAKVNLLWMHLDLGLQLSENKKFMARCILQVLLSTLAAPRTYLRPQFSLHTP